MKIPLINALLMAIIATVLGVSTVSAQNQQTDPVPVQPFLAPLPANASWKIDYTPANGDASPSDASAPAPSSAPVIASITIVRNAGLRRETIDWSDKSETQKWVVKNLIFTQQKMGGNFVVNSAEVSMGIGSVYPDFPQLIWIDKVHYQSVENKEGKKCFLYFWPGVGLAFRNVDSPIPIEPTKVWIDIETKLPVAIEDEHTKATFEYNLNGTSLALPTQCHSLLADLTRSDEKLAGQQMARP